MRGTRTPGAQAKLAPPPNGDRRYRLQPSRMSDDKILMIARRRGVISSIPYPDLHKAKRETATMIPAHAGSAERTTREYGHAFRRYREGWG